MTPELRETVTHCLQKVQHIKRLFDQPDGPAIFSKNDKRRATDELSESETALQILEGEISDDVENHNPEVNLAQRLKVVLEHLKSVQGIVQVCIGDNPPPPHELPHHRDQLENGLRKLNQDIKMIQRLRPAHPTNRLSLGRYPQGFRTRHEQLQEHFTDVLGRLILPLIGGNSLLHERIGTINQLWLELPPITNPAGDHIEQNSKWTHDNPESDGYVIKKDTVEQATIVLGIFCSAWLSIDGQGNQDEVRVKLDWLQRMPKIAMTLKSFRGYQWIDYFIYSRIADDSFFISRSMLKSTVFPEDRAADAERFYAEQRRIEPRDWGNRSSFRLYPAEPHPFHKIHHRGRSSFSDVYIVRNSLDDRKYALKVTADRGGADATEHLLNDAKHLGQVCDGCREEQIVHIVRLVNTFSRGHRFYMLMKPAADLNLEQLLIKVAADPDLFSVLRPALLKAIGCLCRTLVYIHEAKSTRHRDVKPQNILFQQDGPDGKPNFLWSDFGLAKQLFTTSTVKSTTQSPFQGTKQYAAPEQFNVSMGHGRSADVFSYGCVMFEIVGLMLYQEYTRHNDRFPRRLQNYSDNIKRIHEEIDELIRQERRRSHPVRAAVTDVFQSPSSPRLGRQQSNASIDSQGGPDLTPILRLIKKMTCADAAKRPKAMHVVRQLFDMRTDGLDVFCPQCFEAVQSNKATAFSGRRKRWFELSPPQQTTIPVR